MSIQEQVMAKRTRKGLRLVFVIPGRPDPFVCYPADAMAMIKWLEKAEERGWELVR